MLAIAALLLAGSASAQMPEGAPLEERAVAPIDEPGTCHYPGRTDFEVAVLASLLAHGRALEACFSRCVRCPPAPEGRVLVEIEVGSRGRAARVRVIETTTLDRSLDACIERTIARIPMPLPRAPDQRAWARLPIVLRAAEPPRAPGPGVDHSRDGASIGSPRRSAAHRARTSGLASAYVARACSSTHCTRRSIGSDEYAAICSSLTQYENPPRLTVVSAGGARTGRG